MGAWQVLESFTTTSITLLCSCTLGSLATSITLLSSFPLGSLATSPWLYVT